jgi:hypothetical protein
MPDLIQEDKFTSMLCQRCKKPTDMIYLICHLLLCAKCANLKSKPNRVMVVVDFIKNVQYMGIVEK